MLSIRFLFGLVCFAAACGNRLPDRGVVTNGQYDKGARLEGVSQDTAGKDPQVQGDQRMAAAVAGSVVQAAQAEIGVRERGENSGERVDMYNRYCGVGKAPWCASFVSYCFYKAGFGEPRTAWSPALFPSKRQIRYAPSRLENSGFAETVLGLSGGTEFAASRYKGAGLVLGIYYPSKGRIAHCGIVERIDGDWVYSVEGNTNGGGGREGDGVYAKRRHLRTIYRFADWIGPVGHPQLKGGISCIQ